MTTKEKFLSELDTLTDRSLYFTETPIEASAMQVDVMLNKICEDNLMTSNKSMLGKFISYFKKFFAYNDVM